jgi:PAS domain S-box-containing protein
MTSMNGKNMTGTELALKPRLPWPVLAANFILLAVILISGFFYTSSQIDQIKNEKKQELRAIANLKAKQIRNWLDVILNDGRMLRSNLNFSNFSNEKTASSSPSEKGKAITSWIKALQDFKDFAEIRFLDTQGRSSWSTNTLPGRTDAVSPAELQALLTAGEVSLSELYFSNALDRINLDLRVPIAINSVSGSSLRGVLLLSIDPRHFLFPLIQSWPTSSPSAETLLVRREGNFVLYLNELRFRKNTALQLRYSLSEGQLLAAKAARGEEGLVECLDYRGVPVLADIHHIPGTSWSLIAKIDQAEVHRLVVRQEWLMFALVSVVFLLLALLTGYSWHRQQVMYLRRQVETDSALHQSEERYRQLVENLGEGIDIVDKDDNFVFANPAAAEIFGVAPGTLFGRNLKEFLPEDELAKLEELNLSRGCGEKGVYELSIRRPDNAERVLLVTALPLIDDQGGVSGAFSIFRDISERKHDEEKNRNMLAEKELLLKEVYHRVKNNMMVISSLLQIQAQRISDKRTITILQESQNRIRSMITIYEKLYQSTDLSHIVPGDYFSELSRSLFSAYNVWPGTIELETEISNIALDIDRAIPCGLIINELVSNALKYAFPGERKGRIKIEFRKIEASGGQGTASRAPNEANIGKGTARRALTEQQHIPMYALTVTNDGVPLPPGFTIENSKGFGLQLVKMLAGQLNGELRVRSQGETEFTLIFPENESK